MKLQTKSMFLLANLLWEMVKSMLHEIRYRENGTRDPEYGIHVPLDMCDASFYHEMLKVSNLCC